MSTSAGGLRWRRRAAVLLAFLVVAAMAACSASAEGGKNRPEQLAATGPLTGDRGLLPAETACARQEKNAPWYPGIAAFEVHDSDRTHRYGCASFGGGRSGDNQVHAFASTDHYPTPYNLVDRGPDGLYVYGGAYGDDPTASGSFVSRVEPGSLREVWRRVLVNTRVTDEWNYPGVLTSTAEHGLVVIFGHSMARLDPTSGRVLAETELPTGGSAPRDTAYNGFDAFPDGTIIAKTVNRQPGCEEQGFSAFLQCPDPAAAPASVLVAIDPRTLRVVDQLTLPEMIGGRVTTTVYRGRDVIYLPGATKLFRYTFTDKRLAADRSWGPVPYLTPGQTAASAMAVLGDRVIGMTNGAAPTDTPMGVFSVSQATSSDVSRVQPFADVEAEKSFIPSMLSVDPENRRAYVMDAGAGMLGALDVRAGRLSMAWTQRQRTLSFTTLVGPKDERVLIGTDIAVRRLSQLRTYTQEDVVWRDAQSGRELARSGSLPKMTTGILVTPTYGGLQYYLAADGRIVALQVTGHR